MTSTDAQDLATRYIAAWNEADPTRRNALVAALWSEDARYVDPLMTGNGHDGIAALIGGVQARFPDFRFTLSGQADGYANRLRFRWGLGPQGSAPVVEGTDFAVLADDGRLCEVTGFLDRVPSQG